MISYSSTATTESSAGGDGGDDEVRMSVHHPPYPTLSDEPDLKFSFSRLAAFSGEAPIHPPSRLASRTPKGGHPDSIISYYNIQYAHSCRAEG